MTKEIGTEPRIALYALHLKTDVICDEWDWNTAGGSDRTRHTNADMTLLEEYLWSSVSVIGWRKDSWITNLRIGEEACLIPFVPGLLPNITSIEFGRELEQEIIDMRQREGIKIASH